MLTPTIRFMVRLIIQAKLQKDQVIWINKILYGVPLGSKDISFCTY
jgi:hypothetical protein